MQKSPALLLAIFSLCLAVQPARAQGTSTAAAPGTIPVDVEKEPGLILKENPKLVSKLETLLPAGTRPQEVAPGYARIGDFVTALHAAHDLSIPFLDLKCAELGGKFCSPETQAKPMKIEPAILALKPDLGKDGAKHAANTAKQEGKADLKGVNIF